MRTQNALLFTMATLGKEESGRCGEVGVLGGKGCNLTNSLLVVQHVYYAKFMLTVSHNVNTIINNRERK